MEATLEKPTETEVETTQIAAETQEQVADENAKVETVEVVEGVVDANGEVEEDNSFEWGQSAEERVDTSTQSNAPKSIETVEAELVKANGVIAQLKGELAQVEAILDSPIVKAWGSYIQANESPTVTGFLHEVGAVSVDRTHGKSGEELVRIYAEDLAKSSGLNGEDLELAIDEELAEWRHMTTLKRVSYEKSIKEHFTGGKKRTIEELDAEFQEKAKSRFEEGQAESIKWLKRQSELLTDALNKVVVKGKFNGRAVTSEWKDSLLAKAMKSNDILNSEFVRYTKPDAKGNSDLFIPDVIDYLDSALNRNEIREASKKRNQRTKVESLEEAAVVAHNTKLSSERQNLTSSQSDFIYWDSWSKANGGKKHPKDTRA